MVLAQRQSENSSWTVCTQNAPYPHAAKCFGAEQPVLEMDFSQVNGDEVGREKAVFANLSILQTMRSTTAPCWEQPRLPVVQEGTKPCSEQPRGSSVCSGALH